VCLGVCNSVVTTGQVCKTIFFYKFVTEKALSGNAATIYGPHELGLSLYIIFHNLC
jgi:hypothetical protein